MLMTQVINTTVILEAYSVNYAEDSVAYTDIYLFAFIDIVSTPAKLSSTKNIDLDLEKKNSKPNWIILNFSVKYFQSFFRRHFFSIV